MPRAFGATWCEKVGGTGSKICEGLNYDSQGHPLEDLGAAVTTRHLPSSGLESPWRAREHRAAQGSEQHAFVHEHSLAEQLSKFSRAVN